MSTTLIYHSDQTMSGGVSPFDAAVMSMVDGHEILIACPYLGLDYLRRMTRPAAGWRLLTDVGEWLASQAAEPRRQIVEFVLANAGQVRHLADLHAKVLVAGERALAGSANFTDKGITGRVELSVLFDGGEQVAELRGWFESLWQRTEPVSEADLRTYADALPVEPKAAGTTRPLPCLFPKVKSGLVPPGPDAGGNEVVGLAAARDEADRQRVESLLAGKSRPVRDLFERLRPHLEGDGAKVKTTGTEGGDVRYYFTRVNFADIRFRETALVLRLRVGRGAVADPDLAWNKGEHDSSDIGRVRLRVGEAVPAKVLEWVARAKTFTRTTHG